MQNVAGRWNRRKVKGQCLFFPADRKFPQFFNFRTVGPKSFWLLSIFSELKFWLTVNIFRILTDAELGRPSMCFVFPSDRKFP